MWRRCPTSCCPSGSDAPSPGFAEPASPVNIPNEHHQVDHGGCLARCALCSPVLASTTRRRAASADSCRAAAMYVFNKRSGEATSSTRKKVAVVRSFAHEEYAVVKDDEGAVTFWECVLCKGTIKRSPYCKSNALTSLGRAQLHARVLRARPPRERPSGERCGWRPLPPSITKFEMAPRCSKKDRDLALLRSLNKFWFQVFRRK
jgi:hypothetical protein